MLQVKHVSKQYQKDFALNDVSFQIGKGIHFIIGSSGSGKTTLLKILSGIEQDFQGDVLYHDQSIKTLTESERGYYFNHILGVVWQDFNLLEDCTTLENILLPSYVNQTIDEKFANQIVNVLHLNNIRNKKVKLLSGGQKQRIAIARELMKNPQIIIADEPTSALDKESAQTVMELFRSLSKTKTVIIITHDTSLIHNEDNILTLDKGKLISNTLAQQTLDKKIILTFPYHLTFKNAWSLSVMRLKRNTGQFLIASLVLFFSEMLILVAKCDVISNHSRNEFQNLFEIYGDSLTDIGIYNNFFNASDSNDEASNPQIKGNVAQNITGLYDKYANDNRVSFVSYLQSFNGISVVYNEKKYNIESSGSVPTIQKIIAGHMPANDQPEVLIPQSLVKQIGMNPNDILGKNIHFSGSIVNWDNGTPIYEKAEIEATISGVMDTTINMDLEGESFQITIDDDFIFSKFALNQMLKVIQKDTSTMNFVIRAKSPEDMISIKDELNAQGIVPLGQFELIEDIVRLNQKTEVQSNIANIIMYVLAFVLTISNYLLTGFMRKKEYAIYKINSFNTKHFFLLTLTDTTIQMLMSLLFILTSVLILKFMLPTCMGTISKIFGIVVGLSFLAYSTTTVSFVNVNLSRILKAGDR